MSTLFSNNIKLIILLFFIYSCSNDHSTKTEEQLEHEMVLKHRIKTITDYKTDFQLGVGQKEQISHIRNFDEKGFKQKETTYSEEGLTSSITFEYDNKGNLLTVNALDQDSSFMFKVSMNYYENNLRKEYYFYLPGGAYKYRNLATYDKAGKMIELRYFWPDGLKAINKYGHKLIIMTGSDHILNVNKDFELSYDPKISFRSKLERLKNTQIRFDGVIIGDPDNKPDASFFNKVEKEIKRFGDNQEKVIFIGDSYINDLYEPEKRGYKCFLIKR